MDRLQLISDLQDILRTVTQSIEENSESDDRFDLTDDDIQLVEELHMDVNE